MKLTGVLTACMLFTLLLTGQVPVTELYTFEITIKDSTYYVHSPKLLSHFNPGGYTNQPEYIDDNTLLVSVKFADSSQHDIYSLNLGNPTLYQVTQTSANEFSPRQRPGNKALSYVAQYPDTDSVDQRFIVHGPEMPSQSEEYFRNTRDVGYYFWVDANNVAFFLTEDPPVLAFGNTENGQLQRLISKPGRSFQGKHDGNLYFIHKYSDDYWYLKIFDTQTRKSEIIAQTLSGAEDFAIGPDGTFFMGKGSKLYALKPDSPSNWVPVADMEPYGIRNITRLAFNSKYQLALVNVVE